MPRHSDAARRWPPWWRCAPGLAPVAAAVGQRAYELAGARADGRVPELARPRVGGRAQELPGGAAAASAACLSTTSCTLCLNGTASAFGRRRRHLQAQKRHKRVRCVARPPFSADASGALGPRPRSGQPRSPSLSSLSPAGGCAQPLSPVLRA